MCSNAQVTQAGTVVGQPTEGALVVLAKKVRKHLLLSGIFGQIFPSAHNCLWNE